MPTSSNLGPRMQLARSERIELRALADALIDARVHYTACVAAFRLAFALSETAMKAPPVPEELKARLVASKVARDDAENAFQAVAGRYVAAVEATGIATRFFRDNPIVRRGHVIDFSEYAYYDQPVVRCRRPVRL